MTTPDLTAQLASQAFRAWASVTQAAVDAALSVLRDLVETTYQERRVAIVGSAKIGVVALVGAKLSATQFVLVDEATGAPTNDLGPMNVVAPSEVFFEPAAVPPGEANAANAGSLVTVHLRPQHSVHTGRYSGTVLADGVALPRTYRVYVSGVDP